MTDLFTANRDEAPKAPEVRATATFVKIPGGAKAFMHPCGICNAAVAPFGYGVKLRRASDTGDQKLAGRWLCSTCRDCVGDLS